MDVQSTVSASIELREPARTARVGRFLRMVLLPSLIWPLCSISLTELAAQEPIRIVVAGRVFVDPQKTTPLAIQLEPAKGLPPNSFIRLRQVPELAELSIGFKVGSNTWSIPINRLGQLRITLKGSAKSEHPIRVQLISLDGAVHAEEVVKLITGSQPMTTDTSDPLAAPASTEKVPPTPTLSAEESALANSLLERGNALLAEGNAHSARLFYQQAANIGLAAAAQAMGMTYDPAQMARLGLGQLPADVAEARRWYQRAKELGSTSADGLLRRLAAAAK